MEGRSKGGFQRGNETDRADNIGDVRDSGSGRGPEVEDLVTRLHVDVLDTTEDGGTKFGPERVPLAVLLLTLLRVNLNLLLTIHNFTRGHIERHEQIFLGTTGDENAGMTMLLDNISEEN